MDKIVYLNDKRDEVEKSKATILEGYDYNASGKVIVRYYGKKIKIKQRKQE